MSGRILTHLRDNIYGLIAIFIALGGVAYAAGLPANSVGTPQHKTGAVTKDKLAKHAVTGAKVAKKSLTGAQIKSSTLAPVPNAIHAKGADSAAPIGPAGGMLAGSYPTPIIAPGAVGSNELNDKAVTASKLGLWTQTETTPTDSTTPKPLSAQCPNGTTVLSGSAVVDDGSGGSPGQVALSADGLQLFFNGWAARAYATGTTANWRLTVSAICMRK